MLAARGTDVLDWTLSKRLIVTMSVCLGVSGLFSLIAIASSLLLGEIFDLLSLTLMLVRRILFGSSFELVIVNVENVAVAYLVAGLVAGVCTAPLLPMVKRPSGAIFAGVIAALPYHFFGALVLEGTLSKWSGATTATVLLLSVIVGGAIGYTTWENYDLQARKQRPAKQAAQRPRFRHWRS